MKSNKVDNHDYITVNAIEASGARINMTTSRSGCRVTAKAGGDHNAFKAVADAFIAFEKASSYNTSPGVFMTEIQAMVDKSPDFLALANGLARAASVRRMASEVIPKR